MVVLSGEPGVGKSRVVLALQEQLAGESHGVLRYQCLPYYRNSRLQPVIDELERTAGIGRDDPPDGQAGQARGASERARSHRRDDACWRRCCRS